MGKQRVPHCNCCEYCNKVDMMSYNTFHCNYKGYENYGAISVDNLPKTSPLWCPLREDNKITGGIVK
jgi:hypothetical protein